MWALLSILNVMAGVLLTVLGASLLVIRPGAPGGWFFGAFAALWGIDIAATNAAAQFSDPGTATTLYAAGLALGIAEIVFLARFVFTFPVRTRGSAVLTGLAIGASAAALIAWIADPTLFLVRVYPDPRGSGWAAQFGPGASFFLLIPIFGLLAVGATRSLGQSQALEPASAQRSTIIGGALFLFLSYEIPDYLIAYSRSWSVYSKIEGSVAIAAYVVIFAIGALWLVACVVWIFRSALLSRARRTLLASILIPAALGVASGFPDVFNVPWLSLHWLVRIAAVALLAYGILKFQVFHLDLKIKWTIDRGVLLAIFGGVFFLVDQGAQYFVSAAFGALAGLIAALLLVLVVAPLRKLAHRVADRVMPHVNDSAEYLARRRVLIYRAAAQTAAHDGIVTPRERRMLDTLVAELGLAPHEAEAVEREVISRVPSG